MFSLIIVLVSIVLVVALALAMIYYGGDTSSKAAARAAAETLISQATQINAAGTIAVTQGVGWPAAKPSFSEPFLSTMPVPPRSAYADTATSPTAEDWEYYVTPSISNGPRIFGLKGKITENVCMVLNDSNGMVGIPQTWDGQSPIQCFGAAAGYTFIFSPQGVTAAERSAAQDKSNLDGGSSTPGYPRLCPDDTTITSGQCVRPPGGPGAGNPGTGGPGGGSGDPGDGSGGPGDGGGDPGDGSGDSGDGGYTLAASPSVVDTQGAPSDGMDYVAYCSGDMPLSAVEDTSVLTIGGVPAAIDWSYEYMGATCVDSYETPAHAAGDVPIVLTNPDGSTATGTLHYVESFAAAPTVGSLSPASGPGDAETVVTATGSDFTPQTIVMLGWARSIPVTYVSSTQIRFTIPKSSVLDLDTTVNGTQVDIQISNPNSYYTDKMFEYLKDAGPTSGPTPEFCSANPSHADCDPSGLTALKIKLPATDSTPTVFTAVASCAEVSSPDLCLPQFNSSVKVWSWAWNTFNTAEHLFGRQLDGHYESRDGTHKGFSISDGLNSYTVSKLFVYGSRYTYDYVESYSSAPSLYGPGVAYDCATMKTSIEGRGGQFVPNVCTTIDTGVKPGNTLTMFFDNYDAFQGYNILSMNPSWSTDPNETMGAIGVTDFGTTHFTVRNVVDVRPLAVGLFETPYSVNEPWIVRDGVQPTYLDGSFVTAPLTYTP